MPRSRRYPTARLPRTDRPLRGGVGLAAGAHALVVVALVVGGSVLIEPERAIGTPGLPGGGGGGGGGGSEVRYVELPPMAAASSGIEMDQAPTQPLELPNVTLAAPAITQQQDLRTAWRRTQLRSLANLPVVGPGSGTGSGSGIGSGRGGGIGSGSGGGIGSGTGSGTGGEGGTVLAPEPRSIVYPFDEPPPSVRGQQLRLRFWVNERGGVTRVEIDPPIEDGAFRRQLLQRLMEWTFYPARTLDGRPVAGQLVVTYEP